MAWNYDTSGLNQAGMTKEQQDYWNQQAVQQNNDLGYSFQPTYNRGYGGFQTQAELDAYRAKEAADAQTRQVWNGAAGRYMSAADAQAYGQGPTGNPNVVFGGTPTGGQMQRNSVTGNVGGVSPATGVKTAQGAQSVAPAAAPQGIGQMGLSGYSSAGGVPTPPSLGGQTPLADAMLQGYGMGLAPFNTQFYNQLGNSLFQQATQNYNDNINPALNSQAITAGGYGGDRSNLAKGVMSDRLNQSVFNALIPQVTSGYENWLNRGVNTGQAAGQNLLGLGALDISAYNAQNQAASAASNAAGVQSYTNPWATGIGTAISMWPFINSMFGSPTTTPKG